jgi:hypothetical protein
MGLPSIDRRLAADFLSQRKTVNLRPGKKMKKVTWKTPICTGPLEFRLQPAPFDTRGLSGQALRRICADGKVGHGTLISQQKKDGQNTKIKEPSTSISRTDFAFHKSDLRSLFQIRETEKSVQNLEKYTVRLNRFVPWPRMCGPMGPFTIK